MNGGDGVEKRRWFFDVKRFQLIRGKESSLKRKNESSTARTVEGLLR